MADAPERIWAFENDDGGIPRAGYWIDEQSETPEGTPEYVRADLTPPAAVVEAMERALRRAIDDAVADDLDPWFADANAALAALPLPDHAAMLAEALKLPEVKALVDAADAVIRRWQQPTWKDAGPTGQFIGALETALSALKGTNHA